MNIRIAAVSAMSAALIVGGAAAANASVPGRHAPAPSISISASAGHVRAGQSVTFSGRTSGLKAGSKVTLQEQVRGRWVSLPAKTTVSRGDSYRITDRLGSRGKETLRVVDGKTASRSVTVVVS